MRRSPPALLAVAAAVLVAVLAGAFVSQLPARAQAPDDERVEPSYAPPAGPDTVEGQYLVKVPGATVAQRRAVGEGLARAAGLRVGQAFDLIDWVLLVEEPGVAARPYQGVADVLRVLPQALLVEPVYMRYTTGATPADAVERGARGTESANDLHFWKQWGLFNTNATDAWETTFGATVVVAIVDSGVDHTHLDLHDNIVVLAGDPVDGIDNDLDGCIDDFQGCDLVDGDNDPMDEYGHGTHVAGTVAAVRNNSIFGTGIAPEATILPVRVCNASGTCPAVIAGIDARWPRAST